MTAIFRVVPIVLVLALVALAAPGPVAEAATPVQIDLSGLDLLARLPGLDLVPDQTGTTPGTGATCEEACRIRAQQALRKCLANGGAEERCAAQARTLHKECTARCDRASTCEEACRLRVQRAVRECRANGGSEERCQARGQQVKTECLRSCKREVKCEDACLARAQLAVRECMAAGGTKDRCEARGRQVHRSCLDRCDRIAPGAN